MEYYKYLCFIDDEHATCNVTIIIKGYRNMHSTLTVCGINALSKLLEQSLNLGVEVHWTRVLLVSIVQSCYFFALHVLHLQVSKRLFSSNHQVSWSLYAINIIIIGYVQTSYKIKSGRH